MQHYYHHNITFYHVMPYKILISHSKQMSFQFSTFEQSNLQIQHIVIKLRSLFQSHDIIHLNIKTYCQLCPKTRISYAKMNKTHVYYYENIKRT